MTSYNAIKISLVSFLVCCCMCVHAAVIQMDRNAHVMTDVSGLQYAFVFPNLNTATLETANGQMAEWFKLNGTLQSIGSYTALTQLDDATVYVAQQGTQADTVVVFDYQNYRLDKCALWVTPTCEQVTMDLQDTLAQDYLKTFTYKTFDGLYATLPRQVIVRHNNLTWQEDNWQTIEQVDTLLLTQHHGVLLEQKQLINATFTMKDVYFEDSVTSDECVAIAIAHNAKSFTTLRGSKRENEADRPIEESTVMGSAPLNILFKANASPAAEYFTWKFWRFDEQLALREDNEQRYVFEQNGTYKVELRMENAAGCACDTTFADIVVKESMMMAPNVFTPNGDGKNDEFRVAYRSIGEFHCWVFNRWGHQVFSWTDPAKGWDGKINGKKAPDGAYYYIIEAVGTDGIVYKLKGDINLIRGGK